MKLRSVLLCAAVCVLGGSAFAATLNTPAARLVDAVKTGDRNTAIALINQKADVNAAEADGTTALMWASRRDDLDMADRLIHAGADVKAANRYDVTPLSLACLNGNAQMIDKLLSAGANANAVGPEGETPLMTVAHVGNVAAAKVLIAHGANLEAREDWHGETALMWAAAQKHPEMVKALIAAGANVNAESKVVKWERQVTAEPRDKWLPPGGFTALMFAAREGCVECVKALLDAKANPNQADPDGITPMVNALMNGHSDVAAVLVENGGDPNLFDKTGRAALYAAVDFHTVPASNRPAPTENDNDLNSIDLIKLLLAHGAQVNMPLKAQIPYRTKVDRGSDTMLTTGTTPLIRAAKAGDVPVMELLLSKGADAKLATRNGINPLMAAAGLGTNEADTVGRKKTEKEAIDSIELCLKGGTDMNAKDSRGQTALHGAAQKGWDQVVKYLVDHGAKLDAKDNKGLTPLDAAKGLLGGFGFDNTTGELHESTVALIEQLSGSKK